MAKLISSWSNCVDSMPANYVMPPERRPGKFIEVCKDIPVIDLSQALTGEKSRADLVEQIMKACEEFELFQVINHGVSEDIMEQTKSLYTELFNMSKEDKGRICSDNDDGFSKCRLFTGSLNKSEETRLWKDTLVHGCYPLDQHIPFWPHKPTQYREVIGRYAVEVRKLGLRILDLISQGLGLEQGYFDRDISQSQIMAINYYPPCPEPDLAMGIDAHSDVNLITLLDQEVPGLQLLKDEQWVGVEPLPNAFVVYGGYQLQIISNGKLKSARHRAVTNTTAARTSIVTFLSPTNSTVVQPAKEILEAAGETPRFKASMYGEFTANYFAYTANKTPRDETPLDPYKL